MARLWSSGFELNSTTANVEFTSVLNAPTISSTTTRTGGFAGRITSPSSGVAKAFTYKFSSANANGAYYIRVYVRFATLPNANTRIISLLESAGTQPLTVLFNQASSQLTMEYNDAVTAISGNSATLSTNTWYRLEFKFDKSGGAGAGIIQARLDGSQFSTITNATITNGVNQIQLGVNNENDAATTCDIFYDDIAINDGTGTSQTTYPGAGQILHLLPNAAGDNNAFTVQIGGTAGATNNFTRVDEVPPDDVTSYNGDAVSGHIDDFNITDTPAGIGASDTINVVAIGVRYRAVVAATEAAFKVRVKKASAGTVSSSAAITPNATTWKTNANANPNTYPLILYADPDSSAWTKATLDTAQIGYTISATNTNAADISTVWALVDSTPSSAVNASVTQLAATTTATGGTQAVSATVIASAAITQVAATTTATGGTQAIVAKIAISVSQVAATLTMTGGTQAVASANLVAITQTHAILTLTGGTQAVASIQDVSITQTSATLTVTGGTQAVLSVSRGVITRVGAATLTMTGGNQVVAAHTTSFKNTTTISLTIPAPLPINLNVLDALPLSLAIPSPLAFNLIVPSPLQLSVIVPSAVQQTMSQYGPITINLTVPDPIGLMVTAV